MEVALYRVVPVYLSGSLSARLQFKRSRVQSRAHLVFRIFQYGHYGNIELALYRVVPVYLSG